jgi:DNA-binding NarL/FixJ family response regulator
MKVHNIPAAALPVGNIRVLIVDNESKVTSGLAEDLRTKADYEVQTVHSNFQTGATARKFAPHVLLVNLLAKDIDVMDICKNIHSSEDLQTIKVIALANGLNNSESAALLQKGFDGYVSDFSDAINVIRKIEEVTAIIY